MGSGYCSLVMPAMTRCVVHTGRGKQMCMLRAGVVVETHLKYLLGFPNATKKDVLFA